MALPHPGTNGAGSDPPHPPCNFDSRRGLPQKLLATPGREARGPDHIDSTPGLTEQGLHAGVHHAMCAVRVRRPGRNKLHELRVARCVAPARQPWIPGRAFENAAPGPADDIANWILL